jgi:DNA primase
MFEFMIRRQLAAHDLETVEGRVAALRAAAPVVAGIRDKALGVGYVRNLAGWLGMDPAEVQRAVASVRTSAPPAAPSRPVHEEPQQDAQPTRDDAPSMTQLRNDTTTRTELEVLIAMLQHPDLVGAALMAKAVRIGFTNPELGVVRDAIAVNLAMAGSQDWAARIASEVPPRYAGLVNEITVAPIPTREDRLQVYCKSIVSDFIDRDLLREKVELMGAMQRLNAATDAERYTAVQRDLVRIETERRALRDE